MFLFWMCGLTDLPNLEPIRPWDLEPIWPWDLTVGTYLTMGSLGPIWPWDLGPIWPWDLGPIWPWDLLDLFDHGILDLFDHGILDLSDHGIWPWDLGPIWPWNLGPILPWDLGPIWPWDLDLFVGSFSTDLTLDLCLLKLVFWIPFSLTMGWTYFISSWDLGPECCCILDIDPLDLLGSFGILDLSDHMESYFMGSHSYVKLWIPFSHVMCIHMILMCSHVMSHMSCLTCHVCMSCLTHVMSCSTCHVSHVMFCMSCPTCHAPHVMSTCHATHVPHVISHRTRPLPL